MGAQGPRAEQAVTSQPQRKQASAQARLGAGTVVGAGCWLLTVAYFIVQPVVAAAWEPPYDVTVNTISDLGITRCGDFRQFDGTVIYACSPRHQLLNAVFVVVGVLTAAGAVLTRDLWPRRRLTTVGVAFVLLAGVGSILVGLAPADVAVQLGHTDGGALVMSTYGHPSDRAARARITAAMDGQAAGDVRPFRGRGAS